MVIRTAIFALLAFVFARPFIPQERIPFLSQRENQSIVLLIDNSYSMQYDNEFEAAKREVLDRLNAAGTNDEFSIVAFSDDAQQLTPLSSDLALHRNVINTLRVSNRGTDFYQPFRQAEEYLHDARHDNRTIVLISDFQRNGWTGALENWKLPHEIEFIPVKVASDEAHNVFVKEFELTKRKSGEQTALRYDARIMSQGHYAGRTKVAQLLLEDEPVDRQTVPALTSTPISFQQMVSHEGFFQGSLTIGSDDALAVDNSYYFTYPVEARPSILAVDEPSAGIPSDVFFLRNVFDLGEGARYGFVSSGLQRLSVSYLRDFQVVFLSNVAALSSAQLNALHQYVETGGNLILSFGDRINIQAFSNHLQVLGVGTIDEEINARTVQAYDAIIGEVDLRHPIFNIFAGSSTGTILRPKFRRYVRVVPDSGAVVLGRYDTDDPFLVERGIGEGKVLLYTSTFNTNWTDFPVNEMYVPFVYQLVKHVLSAAEERYLYTVGDVVPLNGRPGEEWDVRTPAGDLFKIMLDEFGTGFFRETEEPGHYVAAQERSQFFFSVNINMSESELDFRDREEVYAAIVPSSEDRATSPERAAGIAIEEDENKQKLWRYVLLLVVGLFAFETYYANRKQGVKREL